MENTTGKSYSYTNIDNFIHAIQGWQCPVCKRVMSPYMSYCIFCSGAGNTIEYLKNDRFTYCSKDRTKEDQL